MRETHADQYCWLRNIAMSIAQDTDSPGFHHHRERKVHWISEPPFGESSEDVTMSDLTWLLAHIRSDGKSGRKRSDHTNITSAAPPCCKYGSWRTSESCQYDRCQEELGVLKSTLRLRSHPPKCPTPFLCPDPFPSFLLGCLWWLIPRNHRSPIRQCPR